MPQKTKRKVICKIGGATETEVKKNKPHQPQPKRSRKGARAGTNHEAQPREVMTVEKEKA
jgi:hypothetical protein